MLKIARKTSVMISIFYSAFLFIVAGAGIVGIPRLADFLIDIRNSIGDGNSILEEDKIIIYILAYLALAVIVGINILLLFLLFRVRGGLVFTQTSVALLRYVSWGCFLLCAVFCALAFFFGLSLIIAFAAAFIGFCLRVVKNVLEEATEIKSENDLTV
ncbi:MAG: DUF2975 domain-containing protein [Clostridia bacterium]|nr:DUF2975 domain-containing protein [Clostridia bacterium]